MFADVKGRIIGMETGATKRNFIPILFMTSCTGFIRQSLVLTFALLFAVIPATILSSFEVKVLARSLKIRPMIVIRSSCKLSIANSTLVKVPNNAVVVKWDSPEAIDMACKSDCQCNLKWFVKKNRGSEMEVLYNGYFLRPDAKSYCTFVADEPGKCYLNLKNKVEAAQTYICFEPRTLAKVSADLIWIGERTCNDSSTEDLVNLTCSIKFRGNWAPTMEWKEHNSHGEKFLSFGVNTTTVPNQRVTSTLVMKVQNGSRNYTCTTKFNISGKPPNTTAINVPDYNRVWTVIKSGENGVDDPKSDAGDIPQFGIALIVAVCFVGIIIVAAIKLSKVYFSRYRHHRQVPAQVI